jgi:hypothetical protein
LDGLQDIRELFDSKRGTPRNIVDGTGSVENFGTEADI